MNLAKTLAQNPDRPLELTDAATKAVLEQVNPIVAFIKSRYEEARNARRPHENRWLNAYGNFRGLLNSNTAFIDKEVSKAFIKITKTKVLAAYGQLLEVLFSGKTIPIEVVSSEVPMGTEEYVHIDPNDPVDAEQAAQPQQGLQTIPDDIIGYDGDGRDLKPGDTVASRALQWVKNKFGMQSKVKQGAGDAPDRIVIQPAKEAAKMMNKRVHDQLGDMRFDNTLRKSILELIMLGTGILKGPFNRSMEYPDWDEEGNYKPVTEDIPVITMTSVWNFYPDPQAWTTKQLLWAVERHRLNRQEMRDLKRNASFRSTAIDAALLNNPNYTKESFENILEENTDQANSDRYEVFEYWGVIDKATMEASGLSLGFELTDEVQQVPVNVWICGQEILRFVMNPMLPVRLPYFICPYEFNLYSIFGVGIPENMEDTQLLMNGFMRLAVDNAVLSGSVMLELDESVLVPGQDYKVETGKIFRKSSGAPNQRAVQSIEIKNTSQQNMQMFDTARRLADESTGIPSFSHGLTGVQGVGRTAGGIQALMGAASQTVKTVVKNIDDYWLEPIGQAMIYWNMQYKFDKRLRGDISAMAKGTTSLMQKEAKVSKLIQFAQVAFPNPALAPWINSKEWLKAFGENLELDTELLLNRPDEAQLQARIMQMAGGVSAGGSMANPEQGSAMGLGGPPQMAQGEQPAGPSAQPQGVGNVGKSAEQAAGIEQPASPGQ